MLSIFADALFIATRQTPPQPWADRSRPNPQRDINRRREWLLFSGVRF